MNKKSYEKLAKNLLLELSVTEQERFKTEFLYFQSLVKVYEEIPELQTTEPLLFPLEATHNSLENDEVDEQVSADVKQNSTNITDDYVTVPKVVK